MRLGCEYVQLDAPRCPLSSIPPIGFYQQMLPAEHWLDLAARARQRRLRTTSALLWASISVARIRRAVGWSRRLRLLAQRLIRHVRAAGFLLTYDAERSDGFRAAGRGAAGQDPRPRLFTTKTG